MTNYDPFGQVPRQHDRDQFELYGNRSSGSLWPLLAVIGIVAAAGVVISL